MRRRDGEPGWSASRGGGVGGSDAVGGGDVGGGDV